MVQYFPSEFQPHVVIFPFMAQGHTIPLLDLSKAFASRGVQITIITTPLNAPFIASQISDFHSKINLTIVPFPRVQGLPRNCENTAHATSPHHFGLFLKATSLLQEPFENILRNMYESDSPPIAIISDMFLGWTLESCNLFHIGMGVLPSFILKYAYLYPSTLSGFSNTTPFQIPSVTAAFGFTKSDLPNFTAFTDPENPVGRMLLDNKLADINSWGLISNSFEELEGKFIPALESSNQKKSKVWCIGPAFLYDRIYQKQPCPFINWLNQFDSNTVIYISFGSQAKLTNLELDEIALGLEMAGQNFIWVVKSKSWIPPKGWIERVSEKGMVIRNWVDQRRILSHPAIGGFLTHCGWNSVLEGLAASVPMLPFPIEADQKLNAKYVVNGLGIGVLFEKMEAGINRDMICDGVKRLMIENQGWKARERSRELGLMARRSVEKGGSSYEKLGELIECLIAERLNNAVN